MCRHHQYFNYLCYKKENTPTLLCNAVLSFLNAVNNEFRTGAPNTCKTADRLVLDKYYVRPSHAVSTNALEINPIHL